MKSILKAIVAAFILIVATEAATSSKKSFTVSGPAIRANHPSFEGVDGAVLHTAFEQPFLLVNFVLPSNYKKNSPVSVRMRAETQSTNCNVFLDVEAVKRIRTGKVTSLIEGHFSGLTVVGDPVTAVPSVQGKSFEKKFRLVRASTGNIQSQQALDNLVLMINRHPFHASDTCADSVLITSVRITYETN